ncbi:LuxR C-terminal-related transcriptional regulator [Streptomyces tauricus]|uniref:LuxR C-terminal-related transcriptional regulator n=1 Tax=Streptomyces tauricus TaxID=68274 RepID=A0ABZ1JNR2_9ACTN|nr:LuxR C-terminal-related transcriptional regulator [Streptomyces tauricus]
MNVPEHPGNASRPLTRTPLSEGVRVRVLCAAHGDPLAAAELAAVLGERQRAGLEPLPADLVGAVPGLLRSRRPEVRSLAPATRRLLLIAAADQHPFATRAYQRAVAAARLDTGPLDDAEAAGLARTTSAGVVFRDPWTRIAAYETASAVDRRETHRLLARVLRGEGEAPCRSWHRAAAALGPSRRLAADLRASAHEARAGGEHALACGLLERAAALTPDPRERPRLLARAAADAWRSGDGDRARRLAAHGDVDGMSGVLALRAENATEAFDALLAAVERSEGARTGALGAPDAPGASGASSALGASGASGAPSAPGAPGALSASGGPCGRAVAGTPPVVGAVDARGVSPGVLDTAAHGARPAVPGTAARGACPGVADTLAHGARPAVPDAAPHSACLDAVPHRACRDAATHGVRPAVPDAAAHLVARATEAAIYTGDLRRCREAAAVAARLGIAAPGTLGGLTAAFEGRYEDARDLLRAAAGRCGPGGDPTSLIHSSIAALLLGDHTRAASAAVRAAASARALGEPATVPQAMEFRAYAEFWTGRPRSAGAATLEALRQAYATGQDNGACHLQAALAMFAAVTGDEELCRTRAGLARAHALEHGLGLPAALALWALAFLDLSTGRYAAAASRLRALAGFGPGHGHRAVRHLATPHYVEAAVRTGDTRVARRAHADYDRWARVVRSADDLALSARCRALLATGPEAADHYRTALDLHAGGTRDFERARTELLFGGALRRLRRRTEARDRLHSALEAFEYFGAPHCAAEARAELRALGATVRSSAGSPDMAGLLTAQQLTVARMAAEGATNREIAARLVLSPRTIDHHLRGVFTRLGIRSRIELVRLLTPEA